MNGSAPQDKSPRRPRGLLSRLRRPWESDPELADLAEDADGYVAPRKRALFPPSFLVVFALCCAWLAAEPTGHLGYALFGPAQAVDLGKAGDWHLERARDGARVRLQAFAGARRGTYGRWFADWEVVPLTGLPVLVRRPPSARPPQNSVELYSGEGRLVRLDAAPSSFLERLVRPVARYTSLRRKFESLGELPPGRTAWLLLEGDLPRRDVGAIAWPLALWAAAALSLFGAWRSWRLRSALAEAPPRGRRPRG